MPASVVCCVPIVSFEQGHAQPLCWFSHVLRVILCQQCRKAFLSSVEVVNNLKSPPYVPAIKVFYKCFV
jgi:hypothetical protein